MFCYAINTAIVWGITIYWKISIHMVGIGGPIIALWFSGYNHPIIMGVIIILVGIARIILRAHTPAQVITGTIFAMVLAYVELTLLFL
jgi:membrane-associated phospholipid phosphatase